MNCLLCERPATCHGMCHTHDARWRRWGSPPLEGWVAAFREGRLNTCEVCGATWNGYRNRATCSVACDRERRRRVSLARYHAKPAEVKRALVEKALERSRDLRARARVEVSCARPGCGTTFVGFPHQRFCSDWCRRHANYLSSRRHRLRALVIEGIEGARELERRYADADAG